MIKWHLIKLRSHAYLDTTKIFTHMNMKNIRRQTESTILSPVIAKQSDLVTEISNFIVSFSYGCNPNAVSHQDVNKS